MPATAADPCFVLGMHRSGTSYLTGILEEAGLWLGEVTRVSTFNAKGNRESPPLMRLNDAVLAANGGSWHCPPEGAVTWSLEHTTRRFQQC